MCSQSTPRRSKRIRAVLVLLSLCLVGGAAIGYWSSRSVMRKIERHGGYVAGTVTLPQWMEAWSNRSSRRFLLNDRSVSEVRLGDLAGSFDPGLLRDLHRLPQLQRLKVLAISNTAMSELPDHLPVRELTLQNAHLDDDGWAKVSGWSDLRVLEVGQGSLGQGGLEFLRRTARLKTLSISDCPLPGDSLEALLSLSELRFLRLANMQLSDRTCRSLRRMTDLVELDLRGNAITDLGIHGFDTLQALQTLNLTDTDVSLVDVDCLARLPELRTLILDGAPLVDQGLAALIDATVLERLSLDATPVGDAAIDAVARLKTLNSLSVRNTDFTDQGIERLKAELPDCEIHFGANLYWDAND